MDARGGGPRLSYRRTGCGGRASGTGRAARSGNRRGTKQRPSRQDTSSAQTPAAAQNPLPAAATTSHTIELPGRTLRFKAIAGAIRLSDAESLAPKADIATTGFYSRWRRSRQAPGHFRDQRRSRRRLRLARSRQPRALAAASRSRIAFAIGASRHRSTTPTPGSISPISFSSIRRAPATAASWRRAMKRAAISIRSMATSTPWRSRSGNGSPPTKGSPARNSSWARAMAAFARQNSRGGCRTRKGSGSKALC